jgi:phosphatidylserine/phosphatidylglycerophosphate/cardiolipin synthase-like enzyme
LSGHHTNLIVGVSNFSATDLHFTGKSYIQSLRREVPMNKCFKAFSFVLLVTALGYSSPAMAAFKTYFSPIDNLPSVILEEVSQAQKSIDISIYTFNSVSLREALVEMVKKNPALQVRIVIRADNKVEIQEFVQHLADQKIELRYVTKTNHHKFIIVDGKKLINSSANFSEHELALSYDENLFVCTDCPGLLTSFQEEFDFLFTYSNSLYETKKLELPKKIDSKSSEEDAYFTSKNFEPYVNSKGDKISFRTVSKDLGYVEKRLVEAINQVKKPSHIRVATGHLRSFSIYSALVDAQKRGVKVEMIVDSQEFISEFGQMQEDVELKRCKASGKNESSCYVSGFHFARLAHEAGIDLRIKFYRFFWGYLDSPQMHHKYMIIDDHTVFTGSYNWSKNSELSSFENVAIIKDKKVVASYLNNFDFLMSYGKNKIPLAELLEKSESKMPIRFEARTLTIPEIDEARKIACKKCPEMFCLRPYHEKPLPKLYSEMVNLKFCAVKQQ